MRYSKSKLIHEKVLELVNSGKFAVKTGLRHMKLINLETNCSMPIPQTPSCPRAAQNFLHDLRRYHGVAI